ncbi:hypothetical protein DSM112329_01484 [Paraconexibacter sp. AEG42_29]|uniref:DUF4386 domain-containing protein n=1 Tax=Paraconexibacter sp. AEG42_29 TaxID=2997339 RepID=A0AAU7AST6_9ACTN
MSSLSLDVRPQLWCANCGFIFPLLVLVALFGTGVLPPQSPNHSAEQIAAWYQEDNTLKLAGFAGAAAALALLIPLTVAITIQMFRIEGRSPAMSLLQFAGGTFTWVITIVPMIILCAAAFRPDRDPEITQTLSDLGYIGFFMGFAPFAVQDVAIAVAILRDRSPVPVFARWVAWFNLWVAFLFLPAVVIPFFKVGPFTYRGLLAFWIPTLIYGLWAMVMAYVTRQAIRQQAEEEARFDAAAGDAPAAAAAVPVAA